jgi:processive 1,2-diacylglycerol beta-glucosyltransferase
VPKILILTTNYGNGHLQVARAIMEQFILAGHTNVVIRDVYQETNPRIHEWTKKLYLKSYTKKGKQLYRLFYYSSNEILKRNYFQLFSYGYSKLKRIMAEEQPDAIISTFPTFSVQHILPRGDHSIRTYNVITDYCLHHSWVQPSVDKYYVATPQLKSQLIANQIDRNKILVTGIPIQHQFHQHYCRTFLLKKYHLKSDCKTILVVAGAYGVSTEMEYICDELKKDKTLQILIVCGKNKQLAKELQRKYGQEPQIRIFGYITNMAELFDLAHCVITKPGGVILSEAVVKNVPIVLIGATPGQEKENAVSFQRSGAAIFPQKRSQLLKEIKELLADETKIKDMKASLAKIHVPRSAETIVKDVIQTYFWQMEHKNKLKA